MVTERMVDDSSNIVWEWVVLVETWGEKIAKDKMSSRYNVDVTDRVRRFANAMVALDDSVKTCKAWKESLERHSL